MISNEIKRKLHDIVRGTSLQGSSDHCSTIRRLLIEGFGADPTVKGQFESRAVVKEKQTIFLKSYALQSEIWLSSLPPETEYLTRGDSARTCKHSKKGRNANQ